MNRKSEQGSSRIAVVFWLLVLGALIFVGTKTVPVYLANFEFQDKMKDEAQFATVNRQTPDSLRAAMLKEAQDQDLPVRPQDIHVEVNERGVFIYADYTVPIDLQFYQLQLHFNPTSER